MAVGRKASTKSENQKSDVDVLALIEKGGSVANTDGEAQEGGLHRITVRFPEEVVAAIDDAINQMPKALRPSRNQWIVEAAYAKLQEK